MTFLHDPLAVYVTVLVLSSAVRALPTPTEKSSTFYVWLYGFTHALGANWDKVQSATAEVESRFKKQNPL